MLGPAGLKKDSDVIQYLAKERRVASIGYFKDGIDAFEKAFPFLVGQSLKPHRDLVYPTPVHERKVFLGNWDSAANAERLGHLNISRLVTIHNEPKNLKFPSAYLACAACLFTERVPHCACKLMTRVACIVTCSTSTSNRQQFDSIPRYVDVCRHHEADGNYRS